MHFERYRIKCLDTDVVHSINAICTPSQVDSPISPVHRPLPLHPFASETPVEESHMPPVPTVARAVPLRENASQRWSEGRALFAPRMCALSVACSTP